MTPFEYSFLDETIKYTYKNDRNQARTILIFSILAILVTCLGLIAISVFLIRKRTKEIGLRKINGATVTEVIILLNNDFVKYVLIAYIIAIPAAYYIIQKWIEKFCL